MNKKIADQSIYQKFLNNIESATNLDQNSQTMRNKTQLLSKG